MVQISKKEQKKNFIFSVSDGIFWNLMFSLITIFLPAFIIYLGATPLQVGLLDTFPIFIASFLVLFSYNILIKFKSEKQFIILSTILQAIVCIVLAIIAYFFTKSNIVWLIIFIYILFYSFSRIAEPVYRDWISKIFPIKKMGGYFAKRQIIIQLISIIPLLLFAYILDYIKLNHAVIGFAVIFLFAGVFRLISSASLNQMKLLNPIKKEDLRRKKTHILNVFKKEVLKDRQFLNFLIVIMILFFGVYISQPYFKYFFLHILKFNYLDYTLLNVIFIFGSVLSLSYWGYISEKYNSVKILKNLLLFLPFIPILTYIFATNLIFLFVIYFLAGIVWAGLNLSLFNYFYQNTKKDIINHYSFFLISYGISILLGSLVGSWIIKLVTNNSGTEKSAILIVFIISGIIRYIAYIFSHKIKESKIKNRSIIIDILLQRPVIFGFKKLSHFISYEEEKLLNYEQKKIRQEEEKIKKAIKIEENKIKKAIKNEKSKIKKSIKTKKKTF